MLLALIITGSVIALRYSRCTIRRRLGSRWRGFSTMASSYHLDEKICWGRASTFPRRWRKRWATVTSPWSFSSTPDECAQLTSRAMPNRSPGKRIMALRGCLQMSEWFPQKDRWPIFRVHVINVGITVNEINPMNLYIQENCIRSAEQIQILGLCRGYEKLPKRVQEKTRMVE